MTKRPGSQPLKLAFSLLSVLILLLSACGPQGTPTQSNGGSPVKGGTWIDDLVGQPNSLLPNGSSTTYADLVDQILYTPVFYGDENGNIHPGLAQEIPTVANGEISSDFKTFTFKLRPNLKWSDGQALNADDVDYTWKLYNNPKYGANATVGFDHIQSATVSPDKLSITFHLSSAFAPFLSVWVDALTGALLPKHHFSSMAPEAILTSSENLNPSVVNGPFMMQNSQKNQQYTMVRNPNYYRAAEGLPYLDKIVVRVGVGADTILKDLQAGSINSSWFLDPTKVDAYKAATNYTLSKSSSAGGFEALFFNFKNPVLQDVNVRKAIAMAINTDDLTKTIRRGFNSPLCTDHPKAFNPGYQANAACNKYDPNAANALLDSAGWTKGPDGVRAKNGVRLEIPLSVTTAYTWRENSETAIQQYLQAIGIKTAIQNYPSGTLFGSVLPSGDPKKSGLAEYGEDFTYDADDSALFACNQFPTASGGGGGNYSFYCNKQADALFKQELTTGDTAQRQAAFDQLHQIYHDNAVFVPLFDGAKLAISKNGTHNYVTGPMGAEETIYVWQWWCDNGKC